MSSVEPSSRLPGPLRALAHRNFRLYFFGQAVSILGSWIQQVAMAWLVYRLTGSSALLGVTAFAALIPQLLVGPLAGAWIDRHDKRRLLLGVQVLLVAQALILAGLTWAEAVGPTMLVILAAGVGVLNSFDTPLRQSLIGAFVARREDLPNALALNAMLFNSGRFVGPPIAGLLLGWTSEAACFALNACSFVALFVAVWRVKDSATPRAAGSMGHIFREGVRYAWETWLVRSLIVILVALNLTASSYAVLLPVFARDVFGGDARTLGWLWGAAGCGAFGSTVFLATRRSVPGLVKAVCAGTAISAAALLVFGLTTRFGVALAAMVGLGFGISVCNVGINMLLQSIAPDRLRGRVVSFFTSARFGFDALGGLLAGVIAAALGAGPTLVGAGVVLVLFVLHLAGRARRLAAQVAEHAASRP
ncbi:MAG TPA: MFS transporter [Rhodocyclaceae bacterium]|nr:MFS transporter [Rhodocyclaceae bacterium]